MFKKPEINTIKPDIKNAHIYLRAVRKWGKTTLFKNIILQKYNGDASKGLLIQVNNERGVAMLDNINTTHVSTYKEMIELRDWLVAEKGKEHNIEIIGIDVVDELPELFDREVIRINNLENPNKPSKSIKSCFGGYNAGVEMSANKIKAYIDSLKQAGFGIVLIGHTKMKAVSSRATTEDEKWMTLTGNLASNYESCIADTADMVITGNIEREFEVKGEGENAKNYLVSEERRLYFRGTELIDAGNRMAPGSVPDYIVFDCSPEEFAKRFIDTVEVGMEQSKSGAALKNTNVAKKEEKKLAPAPIEEDDDLSSIASDETSFDTEDDDIFDEPEVKEEPKLIKLDKARLDAIRETFRGTSDTIKKEIKQILGNYNGKLSEKMYENDVVVIETLLQL